MSLSQLGKHELHEYQSLCGQDKDRSGSVGSTLKSTRQRAVSILSTLSISPRQPYRAYKRFIFCVFKVQEAHKPTTRPTPRAPNKPPVLPRNFHMPNPHPTMSPLPDDVSNHPSQAQTSHKHPKHPAPAQACSKTYNINTAI
jgi:hypothetical protein